MCGKIVFFALLLLGLLSPCYPQSLPKEPKCGRAKDCGDCMGIGPPCAWCLDENYDDTKEGPGYRCATPSLLIERGCESSKIEDVKSKLISGKMSSFPIRLPSIVITIYCKVQKIEVEYVVLLLLSNSLANRPVTLPNDPQWSRADFMCRPLFVQYTKCTFLLSADA